MLTNMFPLIIFSVADVMTSNLSAKNYDNAIK